MCTYFYFTLMYSYLLTQVFFFNLSLFTWKLNFRDKPHASGCGTGSWRVAEAAEARPLAPRAIPYGFNARRSQIYTLYIHICTRACVTNFFLKNFFLSWIFKCLFVSQSSENRFRLWRVRYKTLNIYFQHKFTFS